MTNYVPQSAPDSGLTRRAAVAILASGCAVAVEPVTTGHSLGGPSLAFRRQIERYSSVVPRAGPTRFWRRDSLLAGSAWRSRHN